MTTLAERLRQQRKKVHEAERGIHLHHEKLAAKVELELAARRAATAAKLQQ